MSWSPVSHHSQAKEGTSISLDPRVLGSVPTLLLGDGWEGAFELTIGGGGGDWIPGDDGAGPLTNKPLSGEEGREGGRVVPPQQPSGVGVRGFGVVSIVRVSSPGYEGSYESLRPLRPTVSQDRLRRNRLTSVISTFQ